MLIKPIILFCYATTSCNEYQESPTSEAKLVELNGIVDNARTPKASWTSSPEKIALGNSTISFYYIR